MEDKGHSVLAGGLVDPLVCKAMQMRLMERSTNDHIRSALKIEILCIDN